MGNPILWVYGETPRLITLTAPGQTTTLASGVPGFNATSAMADARFGNGVQDGSVWLYQPSTGLKKVADVPPNPDAGMGTAVQALPVPAAETAVAAPHRPGWFRRSGVAEPALLYGWLDRSRNSTASGTSPTLTASRFEALTRVVNVTLGLF